MVLVIIYIYIYIYIYTFLESSMVVQGDWKPITLSGNL